MMKENASKAKMFLERVTQAVEKLWKVAMRAMRTPTGF
jgi:hypothetical protein